MWRRLKTAWLAEQVPLTHGGVVGQVWRGRGPRQALLAKVLDGVEIRALDAVLGLSAGQLLEAAKRNDVIDAAIVLLAADRDQIVTSDPDDLEPLARAAHRHVDLIVA